MKGWMRTRHVLPPEQDGVDGTWLNSCFHLKDRCSHWKRELLVWNSTVKMQQAETSMALVSASSELDTLCTSLAVSFLKLFSHSVMCDSFATPCTVAYQAPRPWNSPGKNTGVGCRFLLQRIFPTQGSNLCFPHLVNGIAGSLPLSHLGRLVSKSPRVNANFYVNVTWGPKTLDDLSIGKRWHVSEIQTQNWVQDICSLKP